MKHPGRLILLAAVLLPFLLRCILVWQDFERLVKSSPLLEDDYFFCLNIARNVVAGNGFAADGETATTGFQWLHQLLCVAATAPFGVGSTMPFRIILTVQVLLSLGAAGVLHRFCRELWGPTEARIAVFLFAWWMPMFRYGNNGLETILQILLLLLFLSLLVRFLQKPAAGGSWRLMAVAGLLVLARIDMVAAGGAAALVLAVCVRLMPVHARWIRRGALLTAAGAVAGLLLALGGNIAVNGHAIPDSGLAVMDLARLYAASFQGPLGPAEIALQGAACVLSDHPLSQFMGTVGLRGVGRLLPVSLLVLAGVLWTFFRAGGGLVVTRVVIVFGAITGGVLMMLYSVYAPAYWFLARYLFPLTLLLLMFILPGTARVVGWMQRLAGRFAVVVIVLLAGWYVTPSLERWAGWMYAPVAGHEVEITPGQSLSSVSVCHNYDIARWVAGNIDPTARIAMWQGGLVAYMVPHRVLHLDGVVNRPAREAWTAGRLDRYLRDKKADYLIDFRSLASVALSHCSDPGRLLGLMGTSRCDADNQVVVYNILR